MRVILATLIAMVLALPVHGQTLQAQVHMDVAHYKSMKTGDMETLDLVLPAMFESAFYAGTAESGQVACVSPRPLPLVTLIEIIDDELANPSGKTVQTYTDEMSLAFVLVNGLIASGYLRCE